MQRRLARERKEYLDKKAAEGRILQIHERKQILKRSLDEETPIPNDIKDDAWKLREMLNMDDVTTAQPSTHVDDEYALAGFEDPRILLTTSHYPSQKLIIFAKEMKLTLPNCLRMNRGAVSISDIIKTGRQHQFTDIIILHETRGEPDGMTIQHLPYGPTYYFTLFNVITRHSIPGVGHMSQQYPHLVFENFSTKLGKRVMDGLRYLFPVCQNPEGTRVITFDNTDDYVSFRNHTFVREKNKVTLTEAGPRFEMRLYMIKLGTLDMKEAETEWVLRPFMNTAKKRKHL